MYRDLYRISAFSLEKVGSNPPLSASFSLEKQFVKTDYAQLLYRKMYRRFPVENKKPGRCRAVRNFRTVQDSLQVHFAASVCAGSVCAVAAAVLNTSATARIAAGTSPGSVSVMLRKRFLVMLLAFQTEALLSSR